MTQWDADIDRTVLGIGAKVTVLSQHQIVRVTTADTLMIETPSGQRFSAVVLERTGTELRLVLGDGSLFSLGMLRDESLHPPVTGTRAFSRQIWSMH